MRQAGVLIATRPIPVTRASDPDRHGAAKRASFGNHRWLIRRVLSQSERTRFSTAFAATAPEAQGGS